MTQRVLMIVESLHPSGLLTQAALLARRLATRGFEPHLAVLTGDPAKDAPPIEGVSTHWLRRRHRVDPIAAWKLRRLVRQTQPQVVHAWGDAALTFAAVAGGGKLVATLGRTPIDPPWWQAKVAGWSQGKADRLVATSEPIATQLQSDAKIIPPGVDRHGTDAGSANGQTKAEVLAELGLPSDAYLIATVANLEPRKRVKELIWASDLVRVLHNETWLVVAGQGPEAPSLARFARMSSEQDQVRMLGPRDDVPRLLNAADMLWHAGDETSPPLAVLEAMAAGRPVVADDTPGCQLAVRDGETGRLAPAGGRAERGRATVDIIEDAALRERLTAAARETIAQQYDADRMADDYAAVYRELLSG
ncbi:MAG: glycosyltransferase [Planctomycetota bacterium]